MLHESILSRKRLEPEVTFSESVRRLMNVDLTGEARPGNVESLLALPTKFILRDRQYRLRLKLTAIKLSLGA